MKRRMFVLVMVLCLLLSTTVLATPGYLVDHAGLLFDSERAEVETELSRISSRYGLDVVIVTVDSTDGQSPMNFADDYYDYNGYRADGILLLVSMEDRDWWISTVGYGITVFTDAGIDYMSDQFVPYLSEGEYAQAFLEFAGLCDAFLAQAETGDPYDNHNLPEELFDPLWTLLIAAIAGLIVAAIATGIMKAQLKSVRQQAKADAYITAGSMRLTHSRDLYLYSHLNRRERPKNNGSSSHTSSSGRTHGGGGGRF